MKLRKSTLNDLNKIMSIIDDAKSTLKTMGIDQWQDNNPDTDTIINDIKNGDSYVVLDDAANGRSGEILAHGTLVFGIDSTYGKIVDGAWQNYASYAAIHRVATAKALKKSGLASFVFSEFEKIAIDNGVFWLRVDTHKDNIPMQNLILKSGYTKSGIIFVSSGARRTAYEKPLKPSTE